MSTRRLPLSPSHTLYSKHMFTSNSFTDCTIRCRGSTWQLHRAVLAQRCGFFRACFADGFRESLPRCVGGDPEVVLNEDDPVALGRLLLWLYTLVYPDLERVKLGEEAEGDEKGSMNVTQLPMGFFTAELSLLVLADKYDLHTLAVEASTSILAAATLLFPETSTTTTKSTSNNTDVETQQQSPSPKLIEDFIAMLATLYLDLSTDSPMLQSCREKILAVSSLAVTDLLKTHDSMRDLLEQSPEFSIDLINALRLKAIEKRAVERDVCDCGRSSRRSSGCVSDSSSHASRGSEKLYIPMNEDSDDDDG